MQGLMMDQPLLISGLIRHAERHHGATEIVSKTIEGGLQGQLHRYTYADAHRRACTESPPGSRHRQVPKNRWGVPDK